MSIGLVYTRSCSFCPAPSTLRPFLWTRSRIGRGEERPWTFFLMASSSWLEIVRMTYINRCLTSVYHIVCIFFYKLQSQGLAIVLPLWYNFALQKLSARRASVRHLPRDHIMVSYSHSVETQISDSNLSFHVVDEPIATCGSNFSQSYSLFFRWWLVVLEVAHGMGQRAHEDLTGTAQVVIFIRHLASLQDKREPNERGMQH